MKYFSTQTATTAIQVHAQTSDAKDAAIDKFHEELQDFLEQT